MRSGELGDKKYSVPPSVVLLFYVQEGCKACNVCSAKKSLSKKKKKSDALQLYRVSAPIKRVAVDIARPLPLTPHGNGLICVCMDYFTKWPESYALPNHEAETIAEVLVSVLYDIR